MFTVFQDVYLKTTNDPRVSNIVKFSDTIGELKVEVSFFTTKSFASKDSENLYLFCFTNRQLRRSKMGNGFYSVSIEQLSL